VTRHESQSENIEHVILIIAKPCHRSTLWHRRDGAHGGGALLLGAGRPALASLKAY
jgi:hypothetical protein